MPRSFLVRFGNPSHCLGALLAYSASDQKRPLFRFEAWRLSKLVQLSTPGPSEGHLPKPEGPLSSWSKRRPTACLPSLRHPFVRSSRRSGRRKKAPPERGKLIAETPNPGLASLVGTSLDNLSGGFEDAVAQAASRQRVGHHRKFGRDVPDPRGRSRPRPRPLAWRSATPIVENARDRRC